MSAPDLWQLVLGADEPGGTMTRQAKASTCLRCDGYRLHGLDADICALDAYVHPVPISALGEVQATIAGLRTYELKRRKPGYQIERRDFSHVRGRPAGSGAVDVLAEHRCGFHPDPAPPVLLLPRSTIDAVPPF